MFWDCTKRTYTAIGDKEKKVARRCGPGGLEWQVQEYGFYSTGNEE